MTASAAARHGELVAAAAGVGAVVSEVTERAAAALSETVAPQGLLAVCDLLDVSLAQALGERPRLVAVLVGVADPGNAGTVVRVADGAGADAVVFTGASVDPYNGKAVRASAGSLFHLPLARDRDPAVVLAACSAAGLQLLAADGGGELDLDGADLAVPTAWLFGSEAHGLPARVTEAAAARVRVPRYGRAESLNLAAAAAVCLYASARAQRGLR